MNMDQGPSSSQSKESLLYGSQPEIVEMIASELKSQGIFDQFRRECHADVDTKPAYQNLKQQVEASLEEKLDQLEWQPDIVKNHVREDLRFQIELELRDTNLERMLNQAIHPKVYTEFIPQISDHVYTTLGLEKPATSNGDAAKPSSKEVDDLVQNHNAGFLNDLEPVSPDKLEFDESSEITQEDIEAVEGSSPHCSIQPVFEANVTIPGTVISEVPSKEVEDPYEPENIEVPIKDEEESKEAALSSEPVKIEVKTEIDTSSQNKKDKPATNGSKKHNEHKKHDSKKTDSKSHKPEKKPEKDKKKHSKDEKRQMHSSSEKLHSRDKSSSGTKPKSVLTESSSSHSSKSKTESSSSAGKDSKHKSRSHHHKDDISKKRADDRSSKNRAGDEGGKKRSSDSGSKKRASDDGSKKQHEEEGSKKQHGEDGSKKQTREDGSKKRGNEEGSKKQAIERNKHSLKESGHTSSSSGSYQEGKCMKDRAGKINPDGDAAKQEQSCTDENKLKQTESTRNENSIKPDDNSEHNTPEVINKPVAEHTKVVVPTLHKPIIAENFHQVRKIIKLRKSFDLRQQELAKQKAAEEEKLKLSTKEFEDDIVEDKPAKRQKLDDNTVVPEVLFQAEKQDQTEEFYYFEPQAEGEPPLLAILSSLENADVDTLSCTSVESDDEEELLLELTESDTLLLSLLPGAIQKQDTIAKIKPAVEENRNELSQNHQESILSKLPSNKPKQCSNGTRKNKRALPEKETSNTAEMGQSSHSADILIPTSPTDNVLLLDKKQQVDSVVTESRVGTKHQHQQRYESCDLYKPRPTFTPSRRLRESAAAAKRVADENQWKK
ncbi:hypothetical protein B566_EDAN003806 [Ephemera danica]|nr:hypothetical protein B566_EDAN003806 [Ephemera danica]